VAADLSQEPDLTVETVKGGLGELSVAIDGSKVFESSASGIPHRVESSRRYERDLRSKTHRDRDEGS